MKTAKWLTLEERRDNKDTRTLLKIYSQSLRVNYEQFTNTNEHYNTRHGEAQHHINTDAMKTSFFNRTLNRLTSGRYTTMQTDND